MKAIAIVIVIVAIGLGVYYFLGDKQETPSATKTQESQTIVIKNFAFNPPNITVKRGTKVIVRNEDLAGHSVSADDGSFDTSIIDQGGSATLTMNQSGSFGIHCLPHPGIKGVITVTE